MITDAVKMANSVEMWPIARLKPYERNAKRHSTDQVAKIANSIIEFGFNAPILVDGEDGIIAGHGRLLAAKMLKLRKLPVIVLTHMTEAQKRAYVIADNKLGELAEWDEDMLAAELDDLRDLDIDLALTGFSDKEIADLIGSPDDPPSHEEDGAGSGEGSGESSTLTECPSCGHRFPAE